MPDPMKTLATMIECIADQGRIVCFEPHWLTNMASFTHGDIVQSDIVALGTLQRLFEHDARVSGKDGNIGMKLPIYLSGLGVQNVECRVSDKVVFLDPAMEDFAKRKLYGSLLEDGIGAEPGEHDVFIHHLTSRGVTRDEAEKQYEAERALADAFSVNRAFAVAPGMKITFGTIAR